MALTYLCPVHTDQIRASLIAQVEALEAGDQTGFERLAMQVFSYQAEHNPVYARFLELLGRSPQSIQTPEEIPHLPIELFKTRTIKTGQWQEQQIFTSSGTTGSRPSRHFLRDAAFYRRHARRTFERFYGPLQNYAVLALLPSYLERTGSSLVFMARDFIEYSGQSESGFYLHDYSGLRQMTERLQASGRPVLLLGVTFALLEFANYWRQNKRAGAKPLSNQHFILMETGGMKGRGPELTREEVHHRLKKAFGLRQIHSEYGMTELLSQAYSSGEGLFRSPPAMRIRIRDLRDPFAERQTGHSGGINITDLANIDSCSFIATQDIGRQYPDGSFRVLGRSDNSELRGCNLMLST